MGDVKSYNNEFQFEYVTEIRNNELMNECSFINSNLFILSRDYSGELLQFYIRRHDVVVAKINIHVENGSANSFVRATYGSIETMQDISHVVIQSFIQYVLQTLSVKRVQSLTITNYPDFYFPYSNTVINSFKSTGFNEVVIDLNHHLEIDDEEFYQRIKKFGKHKKINKCRNKNFSRCIGSIQDLGFAYDLLKESREPKGFKLSMSFDQLNDMFLAFPNIYKLFLVKDADQIIAALISVQINKDIIYSFYYGGDARYGAFAPTVYLIDYVYEYARSRSMKYIDLGRSSIDEYINYGVVDFKQSLGAVKSLKRKFYIEL